MSAAVQGAAAKRALYCGAQGRGLFFRTPRCLAIGGGERRSCSNNVHGTYMVCPFLCASRLFLLCVTPFLPFLRAVFPLPRGSFCGVVRVGFSPLPCTALLLPVVRQDISLEFCAALYIPAVLWYNRY